MRRLLLALACAATLAAQTAPTKIKVDIDRTIGEVHPFLFGNFAEHLGRMIYGGIFEEGSPLSDKDGFRTDVIDAVKTLGVSILRYPGGNFSSGYNWTDGIGPREKRPVRMDLAWNDLENNRFGTDEFLRYCERIKAEPFICINGGLGTIDDARNWVEYTNVDAHTYWADQRRKNGRDTPYKVTYWGLGNEIDGPWQMGHKNAEDYAKWALEAAKAMRQVDRSIKLIAPGPSLFSEAPGTDWRDWSRTVLKTLRGQIDYISIHTYIANRDNDVEKFLSSQTIDHRIETIAAQIKEVAPPPNRPIYIAYDEWNVWYRVHNEGKLEEHYNFEDALAMGMFFNSFFRHADVVKMANLAQLVNVIAPIITSKQGLYLQPIYFPIVEYGKQRGNMSLDVMKTHAFLDVSSTYNAHDRTVYVNVLNRSKDKDISARVENQEGRLAASVEEWRMNYPDLKAEHTFGDDKKVRPAVRTINATLEGNGFTHNFPAHSLTILKLRLQ